MTMKYEYCGDGGRVVSRLRRAAGAANKPMRGMRRRELVPRAQRVVAKTE